MSIVFYCRHCRWTGAREGPQKYRFILWSWSIEKIKHERIFLNISLKTCSVNQEFFPANFSICFLKSEKKPKKLEIFTLGIGRRGDCLRLQLQVIFFFSSSFLVASYTLASIPSCPNDRSNLSWGGINNRVCVRCQPGINLTVRGPAPVSTLHGKIT